MGGRTDPKNVASELTVITEVLILDKDRSGTLGCWEEALVREAEP